MENENGVIKVEITDTFGGEANYSWVDRLEIAYSNQSMRSILKTVRNHFGITCKLNKKEDYGDMIKYKFANACICMFITWE